MPGAQYIIQRLRANSSNIDTLPEHPECDNLILPSTLPNSLRDAACLPGLANKEQRLRLGQADDALNDIRRYLRIASSVITFKQSQHASSQQLSRKTQSLLTKFRERTSQCAARYMAAFDALESLDPKGLWSQRLLKLNPSIHLHLPRREADDPHENQRELSWIWLVPRPEGQPWPIATAGEICDCKCVTVHYVYFMLRLFSFSHAC